MLEMQFSLGSLSLGDFILSAENSFETPPPILATEAPSFTLPMPPTIPYMEPVVPITAFGYPLPMPPIISGNVLPLQPIPTTSVSVFASTSGKVFPNTISIRTNSTNLNITRSGSMDLIDMLYN